MFPTKANLNTGLKIIRKDAEFGLRKQEWGVSETGSNPDVRL